MYHLPHKSTQGIFYSYLFTYNFQKDVRQNKIYTPQIYPYEYRVLYYNDNNNYVKKFMIKGKGRVRMKLGVI